MNQDEYMKAHFAQTCDNLTNLIKQAKEQDLAAEMLLQLFNAISIKLLAQFPENPSDEPVNGSVIAKKVFRYMMNACYQQANEINNVLEELKDD